LKAAGSGSQGYHRNWPDSRRKRVYPEEEVSPDKAVPGTPEEIESGASGANESDIVLPFVIENYVIQFKKVLTLLQFDA
jgi:hypothetical protein